MITRNKETGRFESTNNETKEISLDEQIADIQAKLAELQKQKTEQAEAEKRAKAEVTKAEAAKVEEAFKALNAAKRERNEKLTALNREYAQKREDLGKWYEDARASLNDKVDLAESKYSVELAEFQKNHGGNYHLTLRDGDNVVNIHREVDEPNMVSVSDLFDFLFKF